MRDNRNDDWESILRKLVAYAYALLDDSMSNLERAELAKDFAVEAITKHLENGKFDANRNSNLIWYLKYNILRQLISNYYKSSYKNKQVHLHIQDNEDEILESFYVEEFDLDGKIDADKILIQIEMTIENDLELLAIFKARYYQDSKRSEICADLNITPDEYNNRMKRLKRLSRPVFASFISNKEIS
jgi:DNA-directed RNA polymerase specialized sigma24 family protein